MSEERNYQHELYLKEKENKELLEHIKELTELKYEYYQKEIDKSFKEKHMYPSFCWSVCLTFAFYLFVILIKKIFPTFNEKISEILSLFEFFGIGCAFYFLVYWIRTRKIGKR